MALGAAGCSLRRGAGHRRHRARARAPGSRVLRQGDSNRRCGNAIKNPRLRRPRLRGDTTGIARCAPDARRRRCFPRERVLPAQPEVPEGGNRVTFSVVCSGELSFSVVARRLSSFPTVPRCYGYPEIGRAGHTSVGNLPRTEGDLPVPADFMVWREVTKRRSCPSNRGAGPGSTQSQSCFAKRIDLTRLRIAAPPRNTCFLRGTAIAGAGRISSASE